MKNLRYYKRLPYKLHTAKESDCWTAEYVELRGCKTDGKTEAEAVENLQDLFDEFIPLMLKHKVKIPEPT